MSNIYDHVPIKISDKEARNFIDEFNESYEYEIISHKKLNIPNRYEMTEREQMLFVIKSLKAVLETIEQSPGFYFEYMEKVEDLPDIDQLKAAYCFYGEYHEWEFKDK